jgi:hypothetical protein
MAARTLRADGRVPPARRASAAALIIVWVMFDSRAILFRYVTMMRYESLRYAIPKKLDKQSPRRKFWTKKSPVIQAGQVMRFAEIRRLKNPLY